MFRSERVGRNLLELKGMDRWAALLDDLRSHHPNIYDRIVEWYPSGKKEIVIILEDRQELIYDFYNKGLRRKGYADIITGDDEKEWCKIFAYKLDRMMKIRGMMGYEISEKTGISMVTISKYLNARGGLPRINTIQKIANALDCTIEELIHMDE